MMREIRDSISNEIKDMDFAELRIYIDRNLAKKSKLIGKS